MRYWVEEQGGKVQKGGSWSGNSDTKSEWREWAVTEGSQEVMILGYR